MKVNEEVRQALSEGRGVVALESTLIAHGLPHGTNLDVARRLEAIVRDGGAVPATVALIDGEPCVGLDELQLERIAEDDDVAKLSIRDLGVASALGRTGATTVASTAHLAATAGIGVFATGGLGGVHRQAQDSYDESADLTALATTSIVLVCAGVKSVLDVPATLERLETLGVPVVGYGTHDFPGFYLRSTGLPLDWRVDTPEEVVAVRRAMARTGLQDRAVVVANPVAADAQMDPVTHERVLHSGLALVQGRRIRGKDVTPFLLSHFHTATRGESLRVNIAVVEGNASLAAAIAVAGASAPTAA